MPWTTIVAGGPITAAWANTNVRDQAVSYFASAAARSSAIPSPTEGLISFLADTNSLEIWQSSAAAWRAPWNLPWGNLYSSQAGGITAIATPGTAAETTAITSSALTVLPNRKLMVSGHLTLSYSTQFFGEVRIRRGSGTGGQEVARARGIMPTLIGSQYGTLTIPPFIDVAYTPGASVQYTLTGQGGDLFNPASLIISDAGPNGAPA